MKIKQKIIIFSIVLALAIVLIKFYPALIDGVNILLLSLISIMFYKNEKVMSDIAKQKKVEKLIFNEKERLKTTLASIGDGVISTDKNGNVDLMNKAAEELTGWTQEEACGKSLSEVFNIVNEFTGKQCEDPVIQVMCTRRVIELPHHTVLVSRAGIERFISDSASPIMDEQENINGIVLVFRDFTKKKQRQEKIKYLSYHDQLTGLYNRRFFEKKLRKLDTEANLPITLVMADVNGLKLANDAFGHVIGDKILKKVAGVIESECGNDKITARVGGDEFMVLLPKTDLKGAEEIVQRINEKAADESVESVSLSISFGCETKHEASEEMAVVLKKAEDNMYRHKLSESSIMRSKTIKSIIKALYEKSKREEQHSQRVSKLCEAMGEVLGLKPEEVAEIRTIGLLHDIGKIGIDEKILNNEGKLSETEWKEIKRHSEIGYRILSSVNEFAQLAEHVLEHHERWDGKGYPKGLMGKEITFQARIIAIADAYDAMVSDRCYRKGISHDMAAEEIRRNAGTQFDPDIAEVFVDNVLKEC